MDIQGKNIGIVRDYIVIDLEMTGLRAKTDAILEVGAVRVRGGETVDTLSFFVNSGQDITPEVTALTGITREMAETGITPEEALERVVDFAGEDIWVGHNVIFDYSFLKQLAVNLRIPFEKQAVDTLKLARALMKEPERKDLESLCTYLGIERKQKHRALEDALATYELYQWLVHQYGESHGECFAPKPLVYKAKRQTPATKMQKIHLKELADYHKIELDVSIEKLTRSEASRWMDRLILQYGRPSRKD